MKLLQYLRPNKRTIIAILSIFAFLIVFNLIFTRGAPLEASKQYIYQNRIINERIGLIKDISLSSFGTSLEESGSYGTAQYKLTVDGEKEKGTVYLDMEKQAGKWVVIRASLILSNKSQITLQ